MRKRARKLSICDKFPQESLDYIKDIIYKSIVDNSEYGTSIQDDYTLITALTTGEQDRVSGVQHTSDKSRYLIGTFHTHIPFFEVDKENNTLNVDADIIKGKPTLADLSPEDGYTWLDFYLRVEKEANRKVDYPPLECIGTYDIYNNDYLLKCNVFKENRESWRKYVNEIDRALYSVPEEIKAQGKDASIRYLRQHKTAFFEKMQEKLLDLIDMQCIKNLGKGKQTNFDDPYVKHIVKQLPQPDRWFKVNEQKEWRREIEYKNKKDTRPFKLDENDKEETNV